MLSPSHDAEEIRLEVIERLDSLQMTSHSAWKEFVSRHFPERLAGVRLGFLHRSVAIEELARRNPSAGATLSAASLGTGLVSEGGNHNRLLRRPPPLASGEEVMMICLTEPGSGSHPLGMQATATRVSDGRIINGSTCFIGNSTVATTHDVIARTHHDNHRHSLSAFVVPVSAGGVHRGKRDNLMGLPEFSIGQVHVDDCFVPDEARIGSEGDGLRLVHQVIARHGKPNIGSLVIGSMGNNLAIGAIGNNLAIGAIGNHKELGMAQTLLDALMTAAPSGTDDPIPKRISEHARRTARHHLSSIR